jgi:hypothetical protein
VRRLKYNNRKTLFGGRMYDSHAEADRAKELRLLEIVALVIGGALAVFLDCALPFAFELLPSDAFGLSSGLYLGGAFACSRILSTFIPPL